MASNSADGDTIRIAIMVPKVHATSDPVQIGVADVVMLCVKLWDTEQAIEQIRPMIGPGTAIVSFQHGVLKDQYLRAAFDESQLMGSVGYFATRPGRDAGSPFPTARCGAVAGRLQPRAVAGRADPSRRLAGNAEIARSLDLPLQIGENFDGPKDMLRALQAQACDLVMPDVARIGGDSGWMQAAGGRGARPLYEPAPDERGERASARRHANLPLAGIRRLD